MMSCIQAAGSVIILASMNDTIIAAEKTPTPLRNITSGRIKRIVGSKSASGRIIITRNKLVCARKNNVFVGMISGKKTLTPGRMASIRIDTPSNIFCVVAIIEKYSFI